MIFPTEYSTAEPLIQTFSTTITILTGHYFCETGRYILIYMYYNLLVPTTTVLAVISTFTGTFA